MSASGEIMRAYRGFGASMRRQIASTPGEERLLAYLVTALLIIFVGRVPELLDLSAARATDEAPAIATVSAFLIGWFFFAPLMFYGLAALSHVVARGFSGQGSFFHARLALFWALLVVSPLALLSTIITTALPVEWLAQVLWLVKLLFFAFVWASCLSEAEGYKSPFLTMSAIILTVLGFTLLFRVLLTT